MYELTSWVIQGFPIGCVFALVAVAFVLTYKVSGVFNLAFGAQAYTSAAVYLRAACQARLVDPIGRDRRGPRRVAAARHGPVLRPPMFAVHPTARTNAVRAAASAVASP